MLNRICKSVYKFQFVGYGRRVGLNTCPEVKISENISYGVLPENLLDIYEPLNGFSEVIVYVPGGGWVLDNRQDLPSNIQRNFCIQLARAGHLVISVSVGTAPKSNYEMQLQNLMNVIAWVKANYCAVSSIVLCGYSSGGHLASLATKNLSSQNKALIGICGVYDVVSFGQHFVERVGTVEPAFGRDQGVWEKASPVNYAEEINLPVFLFESEKRIPSMRNQNEKFGASLQKAKLQTISGTNHFDVLLKREFIAHSIRLFLEDLK